MKKHFEFTEEFITHKGKKLHRIKALRDIPEQNVKKDDLGGWVEKKKNLTDNAWVFNNAKLYDNALLCNYAALKDNAEAYDNALIKGSSIVGGNSKIFEYATISDNSFIHDNSKIYGNVKIKGNSVIIGNSILFGYYTLDNSYIDNSTMWYTYVIFNKIRLIDANICSYKDICTLSNLGFIDDVITFYQSKHNKIIISSTHFTETFEDFKKKFTKFKSIVGEKNCLAILEVAKTKFNIK